jgi:hypothetical protein
MQFSLVGAKADDAAHAPCMAVCTMQCVTRQVQSLPISFTEKRFRRGQYHARQLQVLPCTAMTHNSACNCTQLLYIQPLGKVTVSYTVQQCTCPTQLYAVLCSLQREHSSDTWRCTCKHQTAPLCKMHGYQPTVPVLLAKLGPLRGLDRIPHVKG